ncbi:hypothetical protein ACIBEK_24250 [Nocardia fusca]|uniref:hypothetical protein n=1 Tax=Nocardia fusca TaxID=941183 RepID=UPI0037A1D449
MTDTGDRGILSPDQIAHLRVPADGLCWWCRTQPATTGEHKFKATDLARMMDHSGLIWGNSQGDTRHIRGKAGINRDRYKVIKFPKSMCGPCNNAKSQPFDRAYELYSDYIADHAIRLMPTIDFRQVYGAGEWESNLMSLARYYGKHFGCQMSKEGIPVPDSLRAFLDGATDMPDGLMSLVTTDSLHQPPFRTGLGTSPGMVWPNADLTEIRGVVFAAYIGSIGVRYEWSAEPFSEEQRAQFFHTATPALTRFVNEEAVAQWIPRRPALITRFLHWVNTADQG